MNMAGARAHSDAHKNPMNARTVRKEGPARSPLILSIFYEHEAPKDSLVAVLLVAAAEQQYQHSDHELRM